jgi:hypothetical protein
MKNTRISKPAATKGGLLPSYPSMSSMSSGAGIPLSVLKKAKRAGCPAFDHSGRCHLGPFLNWFFEKDESDEAFDWTQRFKRAQALALENRAARERGALVEVQAVEKAIGKAASALRQRTFDTISHAPVQLAGKGGDVTAIRECLEGILWQYFADLGETFAAEFEPVDRHTEAAIKDLLNPPKDAKTKP